MAQAAQPAGLGVVAPEAVRARSHSATNVALWRGFLVVVFLALFGPLLILLLFSFNDSNVLAFPLEGYTAHWFVDAWHDTLLRQALLNSSIVAFVVSFVLRVGGGEPLLGVPALVAYPATLPFRIVAATAGPR